MRAVAAIPAVGLIAGSALGWLIADLPFRVGLSLLIGVAIAAVWAWRISNPVALGAAVGAGFFLGGAMLSAAEWHARWRPPLKVAFEELARRERAAAARDGRRLPEDDETFATVEGTLRSDGAAVASGVSLSLAVDSVRHAAAITGGASEADPPGLPPWRPASGGVQATVVGSLATEHASEWRAGRRVRVPLQLHRPARYLNPEVPDFERTAARRGIALVGTVKSGALVDVLARGGIVDETAASVRAYARRAIARSVAPFSARSAAIVAAIVIGDRAGLDDEVERSLQEAGTYHVIAISGGNIAILAGLLLAGFRLAGLFGRAAMASAILVLVAYERLVGGGASVDRATLMAVVYFGARIVDQRSSPLNTVSLVAACLVAVDPPSVVDPAFVLTFGATLAILAVSPVVRAWRMPRLLTPVILLFAASAATEAMLLPIGALAFSRVTFAGLVLNFAAIPLMAIVQIAGMALVPGSLVSDPLATALGRLAHMAAAGLIRSADFTKLTPWLVFRVAPPAAWVVIAYYAAIALAAAAWGRPRVRRVAVAVVCVAAVWIVAEPWTVVASRGDRRLHVTFIDVGQGDAAFIQFPRGAAMLVDAGGLGGSTAFDVGDRVVAPLLRASGVRRLETLVLTHGDPDHIGGAPSVIREFRPRTIWEGIPVPPFEPLRALRADAQAVRAAWVNVRTGDRAIIDDVEVLVRHPGLPDWERQKVRNDDSIVLELRWRDVSVLLTGDVGRNVERGLASSIPRAPIRVIKVPHHGSLTSSTSELIGALAPQIAIVSAGRANHFGHPVPEVLERYRAAGAEVFRTDQDGAVSVETDGRNLEIHAFTGRRLSISSTGVHHEGTKGTKQ